MKSKYVHTPKKKVVKYVIETQFGYFIEPDFIMMKDEVRQGFYDAPKGLATLYPSSEAARAAFTTYGLESINMTIAFDKIEFEVD